MVCLADKGSMHVIPDSLDQLLSIVKLRLCVIGRQFLHVHQADASQDLCCQSLREITT